MFNEFATQGAHSNSAVIVYSVCTVEPSGWTDISVEAVKSGCGGARCAFAGVRQGWIVAGPAGAFGQAGAQVGAQVSSRLASSSMRLTGAGG